MSSVNLKKESRAAREKRLKQAIEAKHGKTVTELYTERLGRLKQTIALNEPDRVPVQLIPGVFAARYAGLTASAMYYDHAAYREACLKMILEFEPDLSWATQAIGSGPVLELLDAKQQHWPGGNLPADVPMQYVEGEYMKPEEYAVFLEDPSDFVLRYYLPRACGILAPLAALPSPRSIMSGFEFNGMVSIFARPEFKQLAGKLYKAAQAEEKFHQDSADFIGLVSRLGYPTEQYGGAVGAAPFDTISDFLRGMRGTMMDMYRCPDKLLTACDKILAWRMQLAHRCDPNRENKFFSQGMPLHRGSDEFMSIKQFEKFYWPTLKKAVQFNVDCGYIVWIFCEGIWDARLEYLLELPKGKVVCAFERTDMFKAKAVLGNHVCIQGNVPPSLFQFGSPQDVTDYCRKLIKICGKGGGFILAPGSSTDEAKPENVKAMMDSVRNTA
jgi:hypothetical protein